MADQSGAFEALRQAIQMEIDGKVFYLKASAESGNELGRKLLERLAGEEDDHRQRFAEIYNTLREKGTWVSQVHARQERSVTLHSLLGELALTPKVGQREIDVVQLAMSLEDKTYDFYTGRAGIAGTPGEREFYATIASEESRHKLALLDYYEYLRDPGSWFVKREHPSLDGV